MPAARVYLAVIPLCAGCASLKAPVSFLNGPPTVGRYLQLEAGEARVPRTTLVITIRERPGHRSDGQLEIQYRHRPGRVVPQPPEGASPSPEVLDSVERLERGTLEQLYGCREWLPLLDYHGNWGWTCVAPFVRGQPNWGRLARRVDDFRARRATKQAMRAAGSPLDTLVVATWWITEWSSVRPTNAQFALPMRPIGGILDSAAAEYNAEGMALIDSIADLARRNRASSRAAA
jgi:hypothetical protein